MRLHLFLPLLVLSTALLSACNDDIQELPSANSQQATPAPASVDPAVPAAPYRLLDTFQVGSNVYVRSLAYEPEANAVWVGTSSGVLEIDLDTHSPRNTFTREHGLANEYVFSIFVDSQGNKWFGTNGGGVSRYRDGQWKTFFPMHGLADYWIYAFAEAGDGGLWIGTWAGANLYKPSNEQFTTYVKELINEWVYGLGIDSQQRVWFGTEGGVSMFDGTNWQEWNHEDGLGADNIRQLPSSTNTGLGTRSRHDLNTLEQGMDTYNPNYVFAIHIDDKDQIWAGTWGGGVSRFDGKQWHNLTSADGLAGNIVYCITQDRDGAYWFGTNGGATRYDGKSWQHFSRKDGLSGDHVYAITVTDNNEVWLGTQGGVSRLGRGPTKQKETTRGSE